MKKLSFYWSLSIEVDNPELKEAGYSQPSSCNMIDYYPSLKACKKDIPNVIRKYISPQSKVMKIEARHMLFGKRDLTRR